MLDCSTCRPNVDAQTRAAMGCAFLPPTPSAEPWAPIGLSWPERDDGGRPGPAACAGYTTTLPEVREVMRAHVHWDGGRGTLRDRYGGQAPSSQLLDGLEVLQGSVWELSAWDLRPKDEK